MIYLKRFFRFLVPVGVTDVITQRPGVRKIVENISWLSIDKIIRLSVGLFVSIWVVRYLGPEQFGVLSYAVAFAALFGSLSTIGIDAIVVRDLVRSPENEAEILGSAFILKAVGSSLAIILSTGAAYFVRPDDMFTVVLVVIASTGFLFRSFSVVELYFQSKVESKYIVYATNSSFLLMAVVKIILVITSSPLIAFAIAGSIEVALAAVFIVIAYSLNKQHLKSWRYDRGVAIGLMKDGWPVMFMGIAIMIQARIDQVMLGNMVGSEEVGQYSVAMRLIETVAFVPMIIAQSVAPSVARAKMENEDSYYAKLGFIYKIMFWAFLAVATPIYFFGDYAVILLFGSTYAPAAALLPLFAFRLFFANFGVAKSLFITNDSLFRYALMTAVAGSLINILLNYILIPEFAARGAIIATLASFSITIFMIDVFVPRVRMNLKMMGAGVFMFYKLDMKELR